MKNADKPAYPYLHEKRGYEITVASGLTKREAFAMAAMQGILSNKYSRSAVRKALDENGFMFEMEDIAAIIAEESVIFADALLEKLERTKE